MIITEHFRRRPYLETLEAMRSFTAARQPDTPDEIWLVEHDPVFTQGLAGRPEHLLAPGSIPVVRTERGGQVTYHGPGQVVAYVLLDLHRSGLGIRELVRALEQSAIDLAAEAGVHAERHEGAPGVYVAGGAPREAGAKIASVGLKVTRGRTFHGVAVNVSMDLEPFGRINPCGHPGLAVTDLTRASGMPQSPGEVAVRFAAVLAQSLTRPVPATAQD